MANILPYLVFTTPNELLVTVALPFLLIFVIVWGVMRTTKIFGTDGSASKIYIILSFVITLFAAFTDAWGIIATQLATFTGVFVYIMFFIIFIVGAFMWMINKSKDAYDMSGFRSKRKFKNLDQIYKELDKLHKRRRAAIRKGDESWVRQCEAGIEELEGERKRLIKSSHDY